MAALVPQRTLPLRLGARYCPPWRMLFISFGTGCILLSLEVIWFRFLRLYVVSTPTAFAIMLAIVLAGIGLGGLAAGIMHSWSARPASSFHILVFPAASHDSWIILIFSAQSEAD